MSLIKKSIHMKKKLFSICILAITFLSFTTSPADTSIGRQNEISIIPPIIIRPPVNKQKLMYHNTLFIDKSTFVDSSFEA